VRRQPQALPEGALEVARAHPGDRGELAAVSALGEVRLDVVDDGVEATA